MAWSWRRARIAPTEPSWSSLVPAVDIDGPKVRLGLAWAAITLVATGVGPVVTSLIFALVAFGAAGQVCRSWKGRRRTPYLPVAVFGASVCALAASAGPVALAATALVVVVASVGASQLRVGRGTWDAPLTIAIALLVGAAAAAPGLVRDQLGATPALVFIATVHVVDASAFVVNSGSRTWWEGWVAGLASAAALALGVAAVLVPPFRGATPWLLAGLTAVLAPIGTMVATAIVGRRDAPVPALRRLDSFIIAGPAWVVLASAVLPT